MDPVSALALALSTLACVGVGVVLPLVVLAVAAAVWAGHKPAHPPVALFINTATEVQEGQVETPDDEDTPPWHDRFSGEN